MEGGHERDALVLSETASQPGNACGVPKQRLRRVAAERHNHLRPQKLELADEVGLARLDLKGHGIAVLGWAALDNVADVNLFSR